MKVVILIDEKVDDVNLKIRQEALAVIVKELRTYKPSARVIKIDFESLDYGKTDVLENFYTADFVFADCTFSVQRAAIIHHLAIREYCVSTSRAGYDKALSMITVCSGDDQQNFTQIKKDCPMSCVFVPYVRLENAIYVVETTKRGIRVPMEPLGSNAQTSADDLSPLHHRTHEHTVLSNYYRHELTATPTFGKNPTGQPPHQASHNTSQKTPKSMLQRRSSTPYIQHYVHHNHHTTAVHLMSVPRQRTLPVTLGVQEKRFLNRQTRLRTPSHPPTSADTPYVDGQEGDGGKTTDRTSGSLYFSQVVSSAIIDTKPLVVQAKRVEFRRELLEVMDNEKYTSHQTSENMAADILKLANLERKLGDPQIYSADLIVSLLLRYRDAQAYDSMVKLIEQIDTIQTRTKISDCHYILYLKSFALSRRRFDGLPQCEEQRCTDRKHALNIIEKILRSSRLQCVPDYVCLAGRICKDIFIASKYTNWIAHRKAVDYYEKGFNLQPSDYSAINFLTLLIVEQKAAPANLPPPVGEPLPERPPAQVERDNKIKICIESLFTFLKSRENTRAFISANYWEIATVFELAILKENWELATKAAREMYRANPPKWHLKSTMLNVNMVKAMLPPPEPAINENGDPIASDTERRVTEKFNYWYEFLDLASLSAMTSDRSVGFRENSDTGILPVLLKPDAGKRIPSKLQWNVFRGDGDSGGESDPCCPVNDSVVPAARERVEIKLWHQCRPSQCPHSEHEWTIPVFKDNIQIVPCHDDARSIRLITFPNEQFHIFFPSVSIRSEFETFLNTQIQQTDFRDRTHSAVITHRGPPVVDFEFDLNEHGRRVRLGKGASGTVYLAHEKITNCMLAIKEIECKTAEQSDAIAAEHRMLTRLQHRNILRYRSVIQSPTEPELLQIIMDCVPGGSLRKLVRETYGPLNKKSDEHTLASYTRQILEGLQYLHKNHVVHRDIKSDNILVNTYTGVLKICDFGTSKRLMGRTEKAVTFTGTIPFMAPELINGSSHGYDSGVDIWALGCTVIELCTGHRPFREVGDQQFYPLYAVGHQKAHPKIPEDICVEAKQFLDDCFIIEPENRPDAGTLLLSRFIATNAIPPIHPKRHNSSAGEIARRSQSNMSTSTSTGGCVNFSSSYNDKSSLRANVASSSHIHGGFLSPSNQNFAHQQSSPIATARRESTTPVMSSSTPPLNILMPRRQISEQTSNMKRTSPLGSSPSPLANIIESSAIASGGGGDRANRSPSLAIDRNPAFELLRHDAELRTSACEAMMRENGTICHKWIELAPEFTCFDDSAINREHLSMLASALVNSLSVEGIQSGGPVPYKSSHDSAASLSFSSFTSSLHHSFEHGPLMINSLQTEVPVFVEALGLTQPQFALLMKKYRPAVMHSLGSSLKPHMYFGLSDLLDGVTNDAINCYPIAQEVITEVDEDKGGEGDNIFTDSSSSESSYRIVRSARANSQTSTHTLPLNEFEGHPGTGVTTSSVALEVNVRRSSVGNSTYSSARSSLAAPAVCQQRTSFAESLDEGYNPIEAEIQALKAEQSAHLQRILAEEKRRLELVKKMADQCRAKNDWLEEFLAGKVDNMSMSEALSFASNPPCNPSLAVSTENHSSVLDSPIPPTHPVVTAPPQPKTSTPHSRSNVKFAPSIQQKNAVACRSPVDSLIQSPTQHSPPSPTKHPRVCHSESVISSGDDTSAAEALDLS